MTHYEDLGCSESERWEIKTVTALSGTWTNVYYCPTTDGTDPWWFEPCPAVLLLEKVATGRNRVDRSGLKWTDEPGALETQARFAAVGEFGDLEPAPPANRHGGYLRTIPGGEPDQTAREAILKRAVRDGTISEPARSAITPIAG